MLYRYLSSAMMILLLGISQLLGQTALLVTGPGVTNLGNGDQALLNRFQTLGYTVTVKGGSDPATTADATGKDFVFISATISPNTVGTTFRDVTVPVIVSESQLLGDMAMTGPTDGVDFGIASNVSQLEISIPAAPLSSH